MYCWQNTMPKVKFIHLHSFLQLNTEKPFKKMTNYWQGYYVEGCLLPYDYSIMKTYISFEFSKFLYFTSLKKSLLLLLMHYLLFLTCNLELLFLRLLCRFPGSIPIGLKHSNGPRVLGNPWVVAKWEDEFLAV